MGLYGIIAWVTLARTRSEERLRLDHRDGTCVQLSATLERQGSLDAGGGVLMLDATTATEQKTRGTDPTTRLSLELRVQLGKGV